MNGTRRLKKNNNDNNKSMARLGISGVEDRAQILCVTTTEEFSPIIHPIKQASNVSFGYPLILLLSHFVWDLTVFLHLSSTVEHVMFKSPVVTGTYRLLLCTTSCCECKCQGGKSRQPNKTTQLCQMYSKNGKKRKKKKDFLYLRQYCIPNWFTQLMKISISPTCNHSSHLIRCSIACYILRKFNIGSDINHRLFFLLFFFSFYSSDKTFCSPRCLK